MISSIPESAVKTVVADDGDLRLSAIDQCNCDAVIVCPKSITWLPRQDLLSVKEISAIVDALLPLVSKVRTGGERWIRPRFAGMKRRTKNEIKTRSLAVTV